MEKKVLSLKDTANKSFTYTRVNIDILDFNWLFDECSIEDNEEENIYNLITILTDQEDS